MREKKLYHGSKAGIVGAIAPTSRGCCDFGRGFYMGNEPTQPMQLDVFQLQQCEQQAYLFESLDRRNVDAKPFIRAYMNSKAVEGLDADYDRMQWAGGFATIPTISIVDGEVL